MRTMVNQMAHGICIVCMSIIIVHSSTMHCLMHTLISREVMCGCIKMHEKKESLIKCNASISALKATIRLDTNASLNI